MRFSKFWWLRQTSPWIAVWIALAQTSAAALDDGSSSPAAATDGASVLEVITPETPAEQASEEPAATGQEAAAPAEETLVEPDAPAGEAPEEPMPSAAPASEEPTAAAKPTPDGPAESADPAPASPTAMSDASLTPVPDPEYSGEVQVAAASFNGVTPGITTSAQVQEAWGPPKEIANRNAQLVHLYAVDPFEQVEVSFVKDRVEAIVIRLERSFPANVVSEQLELSDLRPVLISNELGYILGQSFPERGVLFTFEPSDAPSKASMKVVQIILEPVSAEAFVLRAETHMDRQPDLSLGDLDRAIEVDASQARAHWLRSRLLAAQGDAQAAMTAAAEAVRLEPSDAQYRLTLAHVLGQLGRFAEAVEEAQKALADSSSRPHVKARAQCLLGDLINSGPKPDYRQALQYHTEAIQTADPLAVSRHPAIRIAAKEVLIDAHLGAGHDIAWGPWGQKEKAVPRWLEQAAAVADDLIQSDNGSRDHEFRVATRALAAYVGLRGQLDPGPWTDKALSVGQELIASLPDSPRKDQVRWDLGMVLYDAVQIYQMRGDHEKALVFGKRAIGYLEPSTGAKKDGLSETYLLGRLYFRLGAIQAVGQQDHSAAIFWFEKAILVFEESVDRVSRAEFGRLGETFVSMGVSFWESGQQQRAVRLTERGAELMEEAVRAEALEPAALEIPYGNLATMTRKMGNNDEADKYFEEAKKYKQAAMR